MSLSHITIKSGKGPWDEIALRFELYAKHTTVTELRRNPRDDGMLELEGRTITIYDTANFLRAFRIKSESDFEFLMYELAAQSKLDIDMLQRRCESHRIRYEITGPRLQTTWRNYIKECRAKFEEARAFLRGEPSDIEDEDEAIEYLIAAADVNIPEAYGLVAEYYTDCKFWVQVEYFAFQGAELKDGLSMYVLGRYYTEFSHDYQKAAKWCVKAAAKGIPQAVELIKRLVKDGKIDPESVNYDSLLGQYARCNRNFGK